MMKPMTTLGEVSGVDWRAEMRANDIRRRVPPPSERAQRPDRGYVEQPEERVKVTTSTQPTARRIVSVIPLAALEREQLQDLADELGEPLDEPTKPEQRQLALQPQPETQPSAPVATSTEPPEMPTKKRDRQFFDPEIRVRGIEAVLAQEAKQGGVIKGTVSNIARKMNIPGNNLANWVKEHKAKHGNTPPSALQTMVSTRANGAPVSGSVSVSNGQLPPPPTVVLAGLEEYIKALVDQRIAAAFRRVQGLAE